MELAFTILAGLGIILFIIGYLGFIITGFKHHFVTGLIAALPVFNVVTVPGLWRNAKKRLILSTSGLVILISSWFLGANVGIPKLINSIKGDSSSSSLVASPAPAVSVIPGSTTQISGVDPEDIQPSVQPYSNQQREIDETNMQSLPKKALYRIDFESVPVDRIQGLKNRIVRVVTNAGKTLEGQITEVTNSTVFIKSNGINELPLANIKQVSLMVKKSN